MIVEERMRTYINSLDMGNTSFLEELERKALLDRVPIIRKEMQSFLKMFLAATRPQTILEVGTAVGFSTLLMCEYGPADLKITTIENYEKRIPIARENFRKAGSGIRRSACYQGMPPDQPRSWMEPMILFLWMLPKGSIFTGCRMCFV